MKPGLAWIDIWDARTGAHLRGYWPAVTLPCLYRLLKRLMNRSLPELDYEI